jgi:dienelactone hydrolase
MNFKLNQRALKFVLALLFASQLFAVAQAQTTTAALPKIEEIFKNPTFGGATISPGGTTIAYFREQHGKRNLAVYDIASKKRIFLTNYNDIDVVEFTWVNDNRILFAVGDVASNVADARYEGYRAMDKDGNGLVQLSSGGIATTQSKLLGTGRGFEARMRFYQRVRSGDKDDVILIEYADRPSRTALFRANTKTGATISISSTLPGSVLGWALDAEDKPRAVIVNDQKRQQLYVKQTPASEWRKAQDVDAYSGEGYGIAGMGPDGVLYLYAALTGDKASIHRFDMDKFAITPEPVLTLKDFDLDGGLIFDSQTKKLIGLHFDAQRAETAWFTPELKAIQELIDATLPARSNRITIPPAGNGAYFLVRSSSEKVPSQSFIFDVASKRLTMIGSAMPWINEKTAAEVDFIRYTARDGLSIPALITYPAGGVRKNLPLVVLAHGGPYVRGTDWGFSPDAQFLASRGYAVLEPDFRGSTGHGFKHFKAGWKQWGLSMQDDLQDGVKHLVSTGQVDSKRVCIAGASYGGYATVMGLIKHPETYKCGVSWVGVTDISLLATIGWSDTASSEWAKYGFPILVGDLEKDAAQLKATSAIEQAARLKAPLILAYGTDDVRVPFDHGRKLRDRLKGVNPEVDYVEYPGEGHGWREMKTNVDFWTRVEKFLDKHIGAPK